MIRDPDIALISTESTNYVGNACRTADTNADGIPDGWSLSLNGDSTTTPSLIAVPGVAGKMFQLDTNGAGKRPAVRLHAAHHPGGGHASLLRGDAAPRAVRGLRGVPAALLGRPHRQQPARGERVGVVDAAGVVRGEQEAPAGATGAQILLNRAAGTGRIRVGQLAVRVAP